MKSQELPEGIEEYKKQEFRIEETGKNVLDIDKVFKVMKDKRVKKAVVGLIEDNCYDEDITLNQKVEPGSVSSTWATPSIKINTKFGLEIISCSKRIIEKYEEPIPKKVEVFDFLTGTKYEYDYTYRRDGVLLLDIPSSCAYKFNKEKNRYEMLTPHFCPDNCKCTNEWKT